MYALIFSLRQKGMHKAYRQGKLIIMFQIRLHVVLFKMPTIKYVIIFAVFQWELVVIRLKQESSE